MNRLKFLIASDTHGRADLLMEAISRHTDLDAVIFLGDGISDMEFVSEYFRLRKNSWLAVRGNCDFDRIFRSMPLEKTATLDVLGHRIVYTHGDNYGVKSGMDGLYALAKNTKADIVLYGHTHRRKEEYRDGVYYVNPGSLYYGDGGRSCAILTLEEKNVLFSYLFFA